MIQHLESFRKFSLILSRYMNRPTTIKNSLIMTSTIQIPITKSLRRIFHYRTDASHIYTLQEYIHIYYNIDNILH